MQMAAQVTTVSHYGLGLQFAGEKLRLSFNHFPWFKQASIAQLLSVQWPSPNHLYWPGRDVDLSVESIRHPEQFPLVSQAATRASM
jgi:hypothetical protein